MDKIPVIIDCDTGIDDMISFVLTLSSKQLDIRGVTTVAGNVSLPYTTYNTINGLAYMGDKLNGQEVFAHIFLI